MEQLGAQAGGLERPAQPDDEREQIVARARNGSSPELRLCSKGREPNEASPVRGLQPGHQRPASPKLEQVLPAGREAPAPCLDQLAADPEPASDVAQALATVLDREHSREDQLHRVNFPPEDVAGEDALARLAALTASQDDRKRPFLAV